MHNTYEQLCINFANEKLQQFFLKFIFKAEEDLYTFENVSWTRIEYQDNQGCIDLIEKSPTGIMRLLDETCKKPNSSDKQFCESVSNTHKRNDFYMEPRAAGQKQYRPDEAFVVRHFAGDVCYQGVMFCEKNNDTLHSDFSEEMGKASQQVLAFCTHPRSPSFAELAPRLTLPHARNPGAPPPDTGRELVVESTPRLRFGLGTICHPPQLTSPRTPPFTVAPRGPGARRSVLRHRCKVEREEGKHVQLCLEALHQ